MNTALLLLATLVPLFSMAQDKKLKVIEKREEVTTEKEVLVDKVLERDVTVTKTKSNPVVIIAFDYSGSMAVNNQLENNKQQVRTLVEQNASNLNWQAGIIPFAGCYPTDEHLMGISVKAGRGKGPAIWNSIKDLQATGATDYVRALRVGLAMLKEDDYADLILFTDYQDTCGGSQGQLVEQLRQREIKIQQKEKYTVSEKRKVQEKHIRIHIMTDAAGGAKLALQQLAKETGGKYLDSDEKQVKFLEELIERQDKTEIHLLKESETEAQTATTREQEQEQQANEKAKQPERAVQKARAQDKKDKRN